MPTHDIFREFVEGLNGSENAESFRIAMAEATAAFDLSCFAYARMPPRSKEQVKLISTYPSTWTDHYLTSHYETLDPVIRASYERIEPFEWGQEAKGFELTVRQREFFEEASSFGIRCGFTIPLRDGAGLAAVTFACGSRRETFLHSIRTNARVLQLMAASLHYHARRRLSPSRVIAGTELTPREFECLVWAARGKSAWATARILGISDATVRFHLGHVRAKLNVTTTRQAIAVLNGQTHLP